MSGFCLVIPLILSSFAFAQLDSNSVTVTASRNPTLQPDLVVYNLAVTADSTVTLDDILSAVKPAGVGLADLSSVGTANINLKQVTLEWDFSLSAPITRVKDTNAMLTALQASIARANPNLALSFSLQQSQISQQLQQSQTCVAADLINDARTKAQSLANAGGRSLGGILAVSSAVATPTGPAYSPPQNCSLTVKFALLGS